MAHIQLSEVISAPRFEVFDFITNPAHLPELLSPLVTVEVLTPAIDYRRGAEAHFQMTRYGLTQTVRFRIEDVLRGSRLTYRQTEGLFSAWSHTIKCEEHGERHTLLTDIVDYNLPMGLLGNLTDDLWLKSDMRKLLEQRLLKAKEHFALAPKPVDAI
jgi:ligand-binding SRPBCC domain-containing protein